MVKFNLGKYNNVPVLFTEYFNFKRVEKRFNYRHAVKKNNTWYAILPWYAPLHQWTWWDLHCAYGHQNISLPQEALETLKENEFKQKCISDKVYRSDFKFYTDPYPFQFEDFLRLVYWDRTPLFIECGLGKSKIVLDTIRHERETCIYFCPAPLVGNMRQEVDKHAEGDINVLAIDAQYFAKLRKALGYKAKDFQRNVENVVPLWEQHPKPMEEYVQETTAHLRPGEPNLILTTYQTAANYADVINRFFDYSMFVADESHKIKSDRAARSKAAMRLAQKTRKRILMSGTASLGTPLDLFPQYRLLDDIVMGDDYYKFFNQYCEPDPDYRTKAIGFKNLDRLNDLLQPFTIVQKKDDVLPDLPARTEVPFVCELSNEEKKAYVQMSELNWDVDGGDNFTVGGKTLVVRHGSVKMVKLKQITGGFVNMAQPDYSLCDKPCPHLRECIVDGTTPNSKGCKVDPRPKPPDLVFFKKPGKLQVLREMLSNILPGTQDKVLVFAHFSAELDLIEGLVQDMDFFYQRIDGKTKDAAETAKTAADYAGPAVLIAQIACGVGWNFVVSNKTIYYSKDLQYESFAQSRDRVRRIGQKENITETHMHCQWTLDPLVTDLMRKKQTIVEALMSKDCDLCPFVEQCDSEGVVKWSEGCRYAAEYKKPTLELWKLEATIHKLAKNMV